MKKQTLLLLAIAGGALILLSMKNKKRGYKIEVPAPEKITQAQYEQATAKPGLIQKITPVVKSIVKKVQERKAARRMGFPDLY